MSAFPARGATAGRRHARRHRSATPCFVAVLVAAAVVATRALWHAQNIGFAASGPLLESRMPSGSQEMLPKIAQRSSASDVLVASRVGRVPSATAFFSLVLGVVLATATVASPAAAGPLASAEFVGDSSILPNLRQVEKATEEEETVVEDKIAKTNWFTGFFDRARLMNLDAVLKAEDGTLKDEERDSKAAKAKAFTRDADKLEQLEKLESELRFDYEENKELNSLQKLLPK